MRVEIVEKKVEEKEKSNGVFVLNGEDRGRVLLIDENGNQMILHPNGELLTPGGGKWDLGNLKPFKGTITITCE